MAVVLPQPLINGPFAPPTNDAAYRSALTSNLGVSGPVRVGADGSRELTLEEKQIMFFGPPQRDVRQDPYASLGIENKILPDSFVGKNNYIRQVILNLVKGEKAVWVEEILPWRDHQGGSEVVLSRIKYSDHLLDKIPEQGVPRLVIQTHDRQTQTIDRQGLAFHMENGFLMTPQGMEDYACNIIQIQQATVSTACLMVIINLLNAPPVPTNYYRAYHLPIPNPTLRRVFDYETSTFGMLTVAAHGFLKMQSLGIDALAAHGVTPDTLIVPHNCQRVYQWYHPESTDYNIAGPRGPSRLEADGGTIRSQAKMRVIESRPFNFGERDLTMDPMLRERGIGKFFQMSAKMLPYLNPGERYPLDCLDTMLMDCTNDNVRKVEYWEALRKCGAFRQENRLMTFMPGMTMLYHAAKHNGYVNRVKRVLQDRTSGYSPAEVESIQSFFSAIVRYGFFAATDQETWNRFIRLYRDDWPGLPPPLLYAFESLFDGLRSNGVRDAGVYENAAERLLDILFKFTSMTPNAITEAGFRLAVEMLEVSLEVQRQPTLRQGGDPTPVPDPCEGIYRICSQFGIPSPFDILLLRPHEVWEMGSAIMMKRGSATGSTLIGHGDFELSRDGNRKMILGYYTVYMGPIIERPENIHVLHNVLPNDYVRGGGISLYDAHNLDQVQRYRSGNLEDHEKRDIFACYVGDAIESDVLDITGRFPAEIEVANPNVLHYDTANAYKQHWGWETPAVYMDSMTKFFDPRIYNVRCFAGTQYVWGIDSSGRPNPRARIRTGKGHLGSSLYQGWVADVCGRGTNEKVLSLMEVAPNAVEVVFT